MNKISTEYLDIPIIRSCNLGCVGCMTFSDHKNIKGLVNLEDSIEWLEFWASKLNPNIINVFGGEPLLHPNFTEWVLKVREIWGTEPVIGVNTNGYYLNNIFDKIPELFKEGNLQSIIVSIQTGVEPYKSKVKENVEILKQKVLEYYHTLPHVKTVEWVLWLDEVDNKKQWFNLTVNGVRSAIGLTVCDMHQSHWVSHYTGSGNTLSPVYDYDDEWYTQNHGYCQAKKYLTLYKGVLYKCPPVGVLEHTLETFNLKEKPEWKPYLEKYRPIYTTSTDEEISNWMETQMNPELVCNMCGFSGPKHKIIDRNHLLKPNWKYTL